MAWRCSFHSSRCSSSHYDRSAGDWGWRPGSSTLSKATLCPANESRRLLLWGCSWWWTRPTTRRETGSCRTINTTSTRFQDRDLVWRWTCRFSSWAEGISGKIACQYGTCITWRAGSYPCSQQQPQCQGDRRPGCSSMWFMHQTETAEETAHFINSCDVAALWILWRKPRIRHSLHEDPHWRSCPCGWHLVWLHQLPLCQSTTRPTAWDYAESVQGDLVQATGTANECHGRSRRCISLSYAGMASATWHQLHCHPCGGALEAWEDRAKEHYPSHDLREDDRRTWGRNQRAPGWYLGSCALCTELFYLHPWKVPFSMCVWTSTSTNWRPHFRPEVADHLLQCRSSPTTTRDTPCRAVSNLMQLTSKQAVKRAILRKTRNQVELSSLLPGQPIAFWRWSTRARQHKRGAWCLGRFLALDPDKRSAWIQVGKTSVKVGNGQLRPAAGWETWTPSQDDVQLLKNAEKNLAAGLWEDGTEQVPDQKDTYTADDMLDKPMVEPGDGDYWTLTDQQAIRHHEKPRYELYIPQAHECGFNLDLLADERQTFMSHLQDEHQPEMDTWRDPSCHQTLPQAWTGRTMFWWRPSDGQPQQQEPSLDTSVPTNLQDTLLPPSVLHPPSSLLQPTTTPQQQQQEQTQLPPEAISRHDRTTHTTQTNIDNRQINIHVESPTYQQYQHYGPQATYGPTPPTARSRRRSRTPSRQPGTPTAVADGASSSSRIQPALQAEQRPALTDTHQLQATTTLTPPTNMPDPSQPQAMEHSDALPVLPMKRPAPTLTTRWFVNVYGEAEPSSTGWDGSDDYDMPFKSQVFFDACLGAAIARWRWMELKILTEKTTVHRMKTSRSPTAEPCRGRRPNS